MYFAQSAALLLLLLSACGQPVCVSGIGKCDTGGKYTPNGGTNGMTLVPRNNQRTVVVGQTTTMVANGGQRPYTFVVDHADMSPSGTLQRQGDGVTALFQAPNTPGWVHFRVDDSGTGTKHWAELSLEVVPRQ
jgi:hypothetical protein